MSVYEIRVAGTVGGLAVSRCPHFDVESAPPVTVIRGTLRSPASVASLLDTLARHGLHPIDVWVRPVDSGA